jgi:hypothetical protein
VAGWQRCIACEFSGSFHIDLLEPYRSKIVDHQMETEFIFRMGHAEFLGRNWHALSCSYLASSEGFIPMRGSRAFEYFITMYLILWFPVIPSGHIKFLTQISKWRSLLSHDTGSAFWFPKIHFARYHVARSSHMTQGRKHFLTQVHTTLTTEEYNSVYVRAFVNHYPEWVFM